MALCVVVCIVPDMTRVRKHLLVVYGLRGGMDSRMYRAYRQRKSSARRVTCERRNEYERNTLEGVVAQLQCRYQKPSVKTR